MMAATQAGHLFRRLPPSVALDDDDELLAQIDDPTAVDPLAELAVPDLVDVDEDAVTTRWRRP